MTRPSDTTSQRKRTRIAYWLPIILAANATVWTINAATDGSDLDTFVALTAWIAFVPLMAHRIAHRIGGRR